MFAVDSGNVSQHCDEAFLHVYVPACVWAKFNNNKGETQFASLSSAFPHLQIQKLQSVSNVVTSI